jgi:radical SAM superfamily enzyme
MKTKNLVEILRFLREKFPELKRVTTYSRAKTVSRKSVSELKEIRKAGLDRVHIGLESGHDPVLKFMNKGVTAKQHIEAGTKVIDAGMSLSEYVMPGLGGEEMWKEHAVETAKALNHINPQYIRLRSLRIPAAAPLYKKLKSGEFKMPTDDQVVEEIKLFIETLDDTVTSDIVSDHIMNLLEEIKGKLPRGKNAMLNVIKKYQDLPEQERIIYRIGRRGGVFASMDDLVNDRLTYDKISRLALELSKKGPDEVEAFINQMANSYV